MRKEYRNKLGHLHREDGPALEWSSGDRSWWINGKDIEVERTFNKKMDHLLNGSMDIKNGTPFGRITK